MNDIEVADLKRALDRYLKQFDYAFKGKRVEGACYWMAWLLVQYATRPPISPEDVEETRAWFSGMADEIIQIYDQKMKGTLGDERYSKYKPQIEQALQWTRKTLQFYFDELMGDPLFPIFKKPLSSYAEDEVLNTVRDETVRLSSMGRPLMVLEDEFYVKKIESFFRTVPERVVFLMVVPDIGKEFRKPKYWGGMLHSASSCGKGVWPIEMFFKPMPKVFNEHH